MSLCNDYKQVRIIFHADGCYGYDDWLEDTETRYVYTCRWISVWLTSKAIHNGMHGTGLYRMLVTWSWTSFEYIPLLLHTFFTFSTSHPYTLSILQKYYSLSLFPLFLQLDNTEIICNHGAFEPSGCGWFIVLICFAAINDALLRPAFSFWKCHVESKENTN